MRQGQQNRRGRGRNNNNNNNNSNSGNNNRKSQNPLTRSFESTGPDVKVRGTPAHVAEKYISLARDALSSGDRVLAENYLQHAEHYNRIILTYREQQMSQGGEFQGHLPRAQTFNAQDPMDGEEFGDEDGGDDMSGNTQSLAGQGDGQPQGGGQGSGGMPQHRSFDGPPRYDNRPQRNDNRGDNRQHNNQRNDRDGNRFDRGDRQDRGPDRSQDRGEQRFNRNDRNDNRFDRGDRQENRQERFDRPDRPDRQDREPREFREDRGPAPFADGAVSGEGHVNGNGNGNGTARPPRRERFAPSVNGDRQPAAFAGQPPPIGAIAPQPAVAPVPAAAPPLEASEQPAFLRRPVRRPRREEPEATPPPAPATDETE